MDFKRAGGGRRSLAAKLFDLVALAPFPVALALAPSARPEVALATLTAALAGCPILFPRLGHGRMGRVVPPLLYCIAVMLLRDALGGPTSGLGLLLLLPVCGVALHGTRAQLGIVLAGTTAALAAPILVVGAPTYAAGEWVCTLVWVAVAPIVGFTVQDLVSRLRTGRTVLSRVAATARRLAHDEDNRASVCHAARTVSEADLVLLLEPGTDGELRSSAGTSDDPPAPDIPMELAPWRAVAAFASGIAQFVPDGDRDRLVAPSLVRATGAASVLYQPIMRGEHGLGVLVLVWRRPLRRLPEEITAAVGLLAAEAALAMERADLLATMSELAHMDPLTGLHNRRSWDGHLTRALAHSGRDPRPLTVALIDLDHFKDYNDFHGHQAGDRFLKEAAAGWQHQLRAGDLLARWGGEEFAVLLPGCSGLAAELVLERLRSVTPGGQTCSVGASEAQPGDSPATLIARVDGALYQAKAGGRDQLVSG